MSLPSRRGLPPSRASQHDSPTTSLFLDATHHRALGIVHADALRGTVGSRSSMESTGIPRLNIFVRIIEPDGQQKLPTTLVSLTASWAREHFPKSTPASRSSFFLLTFCIESFEASLDSTSNILAANLVHPIHSTDCHLMFPIQANAAFQL